LWHYYFILTFHLKAFFNFLFFFLHFYIFNLSPVKEILNLLFHLNNLTGRDHFCAVTFGESLNQLLHRDGLTLNLPDFFEIEEGPSDYTVVWFRLSLCLFHYYVNVFGAGLLGSIFFLLVEINLGEPKLEFGVHSILSEFLLCL
jgi:hypothetical protein